jgi:hypothetical protein
MSYLAAFISKRTSAKPKWNQQKVQSIKTEYFNRPHVKSFLVHLTYLLNNLRNEDIDSYVAELKEAGESIGLKLNSVYQHHHPGVHYCEFPVFERHHHPHHSHDHHQLGRLDEKSCLGDDDSTSVSSSGQRTVQSFASSSLSSASHRSSHLPHNSHHRDAGHNGHHLPSSLSYVSSSSSSYTTSFSNQRLTAEEQEAADYEKAAFFQPLKIDDPQLKEIMQEIAVKSSMAVNMLLIEQKRERLIHAYISLCSSVRRFHLKSKLEEVKTEETTTGGSFNDAVRYRELKGLFEINYFHSSSFEQIIHPPLPQMESSLVKSVHKKQSRTATAKETHAETVGKGLVSRGHRPLQQLLQKKERGDSSYQANNILQNTGNFSFTKHAFIQNDL